MNQNLYVISNVADLVNPATGNTYRQDNAATQHQIPINTLIEIDCKETFESGDAEDRTDADWYGFCHGLRLYVVGHDRDCDQTPLYSLSFNRAEQVQKDRSFNKQCVVATPEGFHAKGELLMGANVLTGFSEDSLKIIRLP